MDEQNLNAKLDSFFDACKVLANGAYVYVCDIKRDYSRWSKRSVDYFGLPGKYMEHAGEIWVEHIHPDDRELFVSAIDAIFKGKDTEHLLQYRARTRNGDYVKCTCRGVVIQDLEGKPEYFCGTIRNNDVLGYVDNITGFRSLYGLLEDLRSAFWNGKPVQIMQLGLNDFSNLNDIYGYTFGNRVLQEFGHMIETEANGMGKWYRMDGTKFAIVCQNATKEDFQKLYKRIQYNSIHDFTVDGHRVVLSFVAGAVNVENCTQDSVDAVYTGLRFAYYESKNSHMGDLYVLKEGAGGDKRFEIERINVIRNSIVDGCKGFFLCYQPIVDSDSEKLIGAEALLRWKNDEYGVVSPLSFVDVLEQDHLFPQLGKWILENSLRDAKKVMETYTNFTINVNLSYTQIEKEGFVESVEEILRKENFPPQNLCLEITERCRLLNVKLLKDTFTKLKEIGVKVALDDFGTGFSSLGILRELPVSTVKIDRSFVMNIHNNESDQHTVKFISNLAEAFSAGVCAEGIETTEMRDCLLKYKIKSFQGYYYSAPVTKEKFLEKYCVFR